MISQASWEASFNVLPLFTEEDKIFVAEKKQAGREDSGIKAVARRFEGEIVEVRPVLIHAAFMFLTRPRCFAGSIVGTVNTANARQSDGFLISSGVGIYLWRVFRGRPCVRWGSGFYADTFRKWEGVLSVPCTRSLWAALIFSVWCELSEWRENHLGFFRSWAACARLQYLVLVIS